MKISILKESLCIGGTERSASNISVALSKKHEVSTVLYYGDDMVYPYGGELYDMHLPPKNNKIEKVINNLKRVRCYREHLNKFRPDVVFQFVSFRNPISRLKIRNCVKIVSSRDFSALSKNIKNYKKMLDSSDAMICNSYYLRDHFTKINPEDKNKVFTVQNIIDVDFIKNRSKEDADSEFLNFRKNHDEIIVSVGRFCKEKAFENLIYAFSEVQNKMPSVGLVFIGDGECKEKCLKIADELGITDSVFFTGYQENPYKYMAKCEVFVLSSSSEGFPNVLVEAMALSLPVIAVNCFSGPAEILMNDYDYSKIENSFYESDYGILTPHYDVKGKKFAIDELSRSLVHLLSDKELMKKYSALSAERASVFSAEAAVEKLESIFEVLILRRTSI